MHGPSEVVDPRDYEWDDTGWSGLQPEGLVIYECHVGTFTEKGTFDGVRDQLDELKDLGVNVLELMPVAAFPGRWGWGYDGVALFAPFEPYGGVEGLKKLIDAAHDKGIAVLLDVVYNHLGPDGNYLGIYSDQYFTSRFKTPWGDAVNFEQIDGPSMRELVIENACYWLHEYHFDGLRLDATHAIFDDSDPHILRELAERARAAVSRPVVIIAENGLNETPLINPVRAGGAGLDGIWADDFHHQVHVFLTGERDGYYRDYRGTLEDVGQTIRGGFFYQGQYSPYTGHPRGHPVRDNPAHQFVFCLQNHDQVGNRAFGDRLNHLVDRESYQIASLLYLTAPETPLLFMGQEFASSAPFLYFTDHGPELGRFVTAGRREEFKSFVAFQGPAHREQIPDPQAESTFRQSVLDFDERQRNQGVYRLYRDLIRLRRDDAVLAEQSRERLHYTVLTDRALALHLWHGANHRLVIANFGEGLTIDPLALLAAGAGPLADWEILLDTRDPRYGGDDRLSVIDQVEGPARLVIPAATGLVLAAGSA